MFSKLIQAFFTKDTDADRSKTLPASGQGGNSGCSHMLALEPRILYDAAGLAALGATLDADGAEEIAGSAIEDVAVAVGSEQLQADLTSVLINHQPPASQLMVVDPTVANWQELTANLDPGFEVVILDADQDGIEQITALLNSRQHLSSLHIVSHGSPGEINLGRAILSQSTLTNYRNNLRSWSDSFTNGGDILIYGCNVASGANGMNIVQQIAELTATDVAASDDLTGSQPNGGDWALEVATGQIETKLPFAHRVLSSYGGVLANTAPVAGEHEYGLSFDGNTDWVDLPDTVINYTNGSVSMWVNPTSNAGGGYNGVAKYLFSNDDTADDANQMALFMWGNSNTWTLYGRFLGTNKNLGELSAGEWHHVVATWDSGTGEGTFFKDGQDSGQVVTGLDNAANWNAGVNAKIGLGIYEEGGNVHVGLMSEVRIWSISMDEEAVRDDMDTASLGGGEAGLLAYYRFNQGTDEIVYDRANGNNGTRMDAFSTATNANGPTWQNALDGTLDNASTWLSAIDFGIDKSDALGGYDIDAGDTLTVTIVTTPTNGTLYQTADGTTRGATITAGTALSDTSSRFIYSPTATSGTDSFTYKINDGTVDSATITANLVILPNAAPTITAAAPAITAIDGGGANTAGELVSTFVGTSIADIDVGAVEGIAIYASTAENGTWQFSIDAGTTWTAMGTVSNAAALLLRPEDKMRYIGGGSEDSTAATFSFRAWDQVSGTAGNTADVSSVGGTTAFSSATDTATVTAPVVVAGGTLAYSENTASSIVDSTITVTHADGALIYGATLTIASNYQSGKDTLEFTDTVNITGSWDATTATLTLSGGDTAANYQTALRSVTYVNSDDEPNSTDSATAVARSISINAHDGVSTSSAVTSTINVSPTNDAPVISVPGALVVDSDTDLAIAGISLADVDAGTGDLLLTLQATNGQLTFGTTTGLTFQVGQNGDGLLSVSGSLSDINTALASLIYRGDTSYVGADSLTVAISDLGNAGTSGVAGTDIETIAITVNQGQRSPVPGIDALFTDEDTSLTITAATDLLLNDFDADGDTLSIAAVGQPSNGTLTDNGDGTYTYTPNANYNGLDVFSHWVTDGNSSVQTSTTIIVNPIWDELDAVDDSSGDVREDSSKTVSSVLLNDSDPDYVGGGFNPNFKVIGFTSPSNGSVVYNGDGTFTYTPNKDFYGTDSFTYTLNAGDQRVDIATITITVTGVNDLPTLTVNNGLSIIEAGSWEIGSDKLLAVDSDSSTSEITYTLKSMPTTGELQLSGVAMQNGDTFSQSDIDSGLFVYLYAGTTDVAESFTFTVGDGSASSLTDANVLTFNITVELYTPNANQMLQESSAHIWQKIADSSEVLADTSLLYDTMPTNRGASPAPAGSIGLTGFSLTDGQAPVLSVVRGLPRTVALSASSTPVLTAVRNSSPGVLDGSMVTPVLTAVKHSLALNAPGASITPILSTVIATRTEGVAGGAGSWFGQGQVMDSTIWKSLPEESPIDKTPDQLLENSLPDSMSNSFSEQVVKAGGRLDAEVATLLTSVY